MLAGSQNLLGICLCALSSPSQAFLETGLGQSTIHVAMVSVEGMALPIDDKQTFRIPSPPSILYNFIKLFLGDK